MNTILSFLKTVFAQGWKKITFIFIMFLLTGVSYLTMFYYWNEIKRNTNITQEVYEQIQKMDESNVYNKIYGINNIAFERSIKTKLIEHRISTKSNVVMFFGFHNGQRIGADFHAKRMSLISEDHAEYTNINVLDINTFNVALFAITIDEVLTNRMYFSHITKIEEYTMKSFMKSFNNYYIMATPVRIDGTPIGILFTFWDKFETQKIISNPSVLEKNIKKQTETSSYFEFKFQSIEE